MAVEHLNHGISWQSGKQIHTNTTRKPWISYQTTLPWNAGISCLQFCQELQLIPHHLAREILRRMIGEPGEPHGSNMFHLGEVQVNVEGRTGGARICVPAWNAVVTAKSEKAEPGL